MTQSSEVTLKLREPGINKLPPPGDGILGLPELQGRESTVPFGTERELLWELTRMEKDRENRNWAFTLQSLTQYSVRVS